MKKKLLIPLILFGSILLISAITISNYSLGVDSKTKEEIDKIGLGEIQYFKTCSDTHCDIKMWKWTNSNQTQRYGLGSISYQTVYCSTHDEETGDCLKYSDYTPQELKDIEDGLISDKLDRIVEVKTARENKGSMVETEGEISLNNK